MRPVYKNRSTGFFEHDFRIAGVPRFHVSYGVAKKQDAERLHAVATALFKGRDTTRDVIEAWRRGEVTIEQLAQLRESGKPFSEALQRRRVADPWPTIPDAIQAYLEALGKKAGVTGAAGTARVAKQELARFLKFMEARTRGFQFRLDELTSAMVEEYQSALIASGNKPNTVSAYVSRVGSVYHWHIRREARNARELNRSPRFLHVPLDPETISRAKTARVRYLNESEANRLIAATPAPLLFPVAAGLFGGFRVDEVMHFRTEHDVDLDVGILSVQRQPTWTPKTKRSIRHVPIAKALRPILERHIERYASDDWLMPSFRDPTAPLNSKLFARHFARIVEDADLISGNKDPEGVTFHSLRHSCASWLLMSGTDVFTVAKLLGNTVSQVENVYGHLALDFRQAAVDRLSVGVLLPELNRTGDE